MGEGLDQQRLKFTFRIWHGAFAAAVGSFTGMAVAASYYSNFDLDLILAQNLQAVSIPGFKTLMIWISALGSGWVPVALVGAISLALLAKRRRYEALVLAAGVGSGAALNRVIKVVVDRPRPSVDALSVAIGYQHESFPSGHTVLFMTLFGFLFLLTYWLFKSRFARAVLMLVFAGLIMFVGISRVYLGAHWPSDVLGGYLLGFVLLAVMAAVYKRPEGRGQRSEARGQESP